MLRRRGRGKVHEHSELHHIWQEMAQERLAAQTAVFVWSWGKLRDGRSTLAKICNYVASAKSLACKLLKLLKLGVASVMCFIWKKINLVIDHTCVCMWFDLQAGHNLVCEHHKSVLNMRAKRKRKDSEEESDYQPEVLKK